MFGCCFCSSFGVFCGGLGELGQGVGGGGVLGGPHQDAVGADLVAARHCRLTRHARPRRGSLARHGRPRGLGGGVLAPGTPPALGDTVDVDGVAACDDQQDDGDADPPIHRISPQPRRHTTRGAAAEGGATLTRPTLPTVVYAREPGPARPPSPRTDEATTKEASPGLNGAQEGLFLLLAHGSLGQGWYLHGVCPPH